MRHIFRAYDIRGVWGSDLDAGLCLDIGKGLGSFLKEDLGLGNVVVGYDVRTTSPSFHGALVSGLSSCGVDIRSVGKCGFGVAMFAGSDSGADASCFITASHLEPEWNGLKVYFGDGVGFPEENIMAIRDRVLERRFTEVPWEKMGSYSEENYLERYVDFWASRYSKLLKEKEPRIGVDCGGGAMTLSAPHVLKASGARIDLVHGEADPFFRGRPSEPKPENLSKLKETVLREELDFGIAFDGDGDRAVVVDDTGRFLSTDRLGIIIASSLIKRDGGGLVLANVESSMAVEDVLIPEGARIKRIKVGHTFLTMEAKLHNAVFGVEKSGHLIVPEHVLFDDAIVAPLELMRILCDDDRKLSEIADEIPQYHSKSLALDCPDDTKFEVVASLQDELGRTEERVNTQDGVRVDMEEGWVLIRCSNTSPVIRMTVEARSETSLKSITDRYGSILKSAIEDNN
jgi:phosphomannomutase